MRKVFFLGLLLLIGCGKESYRLDNGEYLVSADKKYEGSTTAGNLITTAIKEVHQLDMVFYPSDFLNESLNGLVRPNLTPREITELKKLFPTATKDQFMVGTMKGKDIKKFVIGRSNDTYRADLQVAGLRYHIHTVGGVRQYAYFNRPEGLEFEDNEYYNVAISHYFYFSGQTFPSYKYRNSFSHSFNFSSTIISARDSLETYLKTIKNLPYLKEIRAKYTSFIKGDAGAVKIYQIQGESHRSPLLGKRVTTSGIVTAFGSVDWYPGGMDIIIQDKNGDGNDHTSDAVHIHVDNKALNIQLGDHISVTGVVYEEMMGNGLGKTSIREVIKLSTISSGNALPAPVILGMRGRPIPDFKISSFIGDLNFKPNLSLFEGIDFYESLEGMRIEINNPAVVGFRGGKEEYEGQRPKGHLSLYLVPDSKARHDGRTLPGGIIIGEKGEDYNPEIIQLSASHLSRGINTETIFNIGDILEGAIVGNMSFEKNIFGGGDYTMVLPLAQKALGHEFKGRGLVPLSSRPKTALVSSKDHLTVASFNVENLAGNQPLRIKEIGRSIKTNLKCPDIVNLVEIQDNNGVSLNGGPDAQLTLEKLIKKIKCGVNVEYKSINIDPLNHSEGGQPGGNIRVSMIYNAKRVGFSPRGQSGALEETRVGPDGSLNINPGRVFPGSDAFNRTRKSLVVEFTFKGEKVLLIGNHFNSKLGDTSFWSAQQPPRSRSEVRRVPVAEKVNEFVRILNQRNPKANIIVLGDFNALVHEASMRVLAGNELYNLMTYKNLVDPKDRYTTNHNGNSQPLDYIFVNGNLINKSPEFEILHINSDFMGRLSDHDPIIGRFNF